MIKVEQMLNNLKNDLSLSTIQNGETVVIRSVKDSSLKVKLMEMGLIVGKRMTVLFRAPLGDPIAYDVEGYILSLRIDEANQITVEHQSPVI